MALEVAYRRRRIQKGLQNIREDVERASGRTTEVEPWHP